MDTWKQFLVMLKDLSQPPKESYLFMSRAKELDAPVQCDWKG